MLCVYLGLVYSWMKKQRRTKHQRPVRMQQQLAPLSDGYIVWFEVYVCPSNGRSGHYLHKIICANWFAKAFHPHTHTRKHTHMRNNNSSLCASTKIFICAQTISHNYFKQCECTFASKLSLLILSPFYRNIFFRCNFVSMRLKTISDQASTARWCWLITQCVYRVCENNNDFNNFHLLVTAHCSEKHFVDGSSSKR